jgi:hypothetical protein
VYQKRPFLVLPQPRLYPKRFYAAFAYQKTYQYQSTETSMTRWVSKHASLYLKFQTLNPGVDEHPDQLSLPEESEEVEARRQPVHDDDAGAVHPNATETPSEDAGDTPVPPERDKRSWLRRLFGL